MSDTIVVIETIVCAMISAGIGVTFLIGAMITYARVHEIHRKLFPEQYKDEKDK